MKPGPIEGSDPLGPPIIDTGHRGRCRLGRGEQGTLFPTRAARFKHAPRSVKRAEHTHAGDTTAGHAHARRTRHDRPPTREPRSGRDLPGFSRDGFTSDEAGRPGRPFAGLPAFDFIANESASHPGRSSRCRGCAGITGATRHASDPRRHRRHAARDSRPSSDPHHGESPERTSPCPHACASLTPPSERGRNCPRPELELRQGAKRNSGISRPVTRHTIHRKSVA